jgi:glycosyltransferase involved in cell wall biosynthesis
VGVQDDITPYFAAADIFALTSREDPFPLVSMEAMSFGLPVVAFEGAGGAPELIGDQAGVVVPHLDLAAMAEAVTKLANDPQRREALGEGAMRSVATDFSPERYAEQLLGLAEAGQAAAPRVPRAD